ncbi:hypothetical protein FHW72_001878 [Ochrobactrum sp. RC6B]|nr:MULTISPECIES: hypothetical protein [Brucella/Ochrobactrum group]MBB3216807.1 hypothetical protein [Ochrobactrum sp. RC6B]
MGCISKFAYATLLGLVVSLASGVALSQEDEEIEGTVVDLGEDSPALHFPIGMSGKQVLVVPAFEDYAFMLEDACNAMKLTVEDGCNILPMNADLGGNAIATILDGSQVIIYDRQMSPEAGYDGAMAIIAHELGHHYCGHLGKKADPSQELEADRFSGAAMRRSNMPLESALPMAKLMDERPSRTHPARADRVEAFKSGWNDPESAEACRKS